ncbi:hypothetical protein M885DRAFT_565763 [Pelagophyceae sp. CCMP2097]|nr:hypothetical protein M885DRAFT_565763 [Pelagophyceae sp. CCMP2097]
MSPYWKYVCCGGSRRASEYAEDSPVTLAAPPAAAAPRWDRAAAQPPGAKAQPPRAGAPRGVGARSSEARSRSSDAAERADGRAVRLVVVGAPEGKLRLAASQKRKAYGFSAAARTEVKVVGETHVTFYDCPPRDLDAPNKASDFEALVSRAQGAIIVADAQDAGWWETALRWNARLAREKKLPVALLLKANHTYARSSFRAGEMIFGEGAETCVGSFVCGGPDNEGTAPDEAPACVAALLRRIEARDGAGDARRAKSARKSIRPGADEDHDRPRSLSEGPAPKPRNDFGVV